LIWRPVRLCPQRRHALCAISSSTP